MGLDLPDAAFVPGGQDQRVFSTVLVLVLMAGILVGGLLGDLFGRRRVMLLSTLVSAAAGLASSLALDLPWLVVTRVVALASGAMAFPLALAVIRLTFAGRERGFAMLVYTVVTFGSLVVALLTLVEAVAGGYGTLALPTAASTVGLYMTWRYIPESRAGTHLVRQAATAVAWALTFLPMTLGFVAAQLAGSWSNPVTMVALAIAGLGVALLALVWRGRIRANVTIDIRRRRRHLLTVMLLCQGALSLGVTGFAVQLYGFFSVVQGYGEIVAGVALAPMLAAAPLAVRHVTRLAPRLDARHLIAGGLALMGMAILVTALIRPGVPYWLLVLPLALCGFGYLVAQTAWTSAFMSVMPDAVVGASAGIMNATSATGAALGGALLGTVLLLVGHAEFEHRLIALGLSQEQISLASATLNSVLRADAGLDDSIPQSDLVQRGLLGVYHEAYTIGLAEGLVIVGAICLLAATAAWLVLESRRPDEPSHSLTTDSGPGDLI
jgi:MFS family permease